MPGVKSWADLEVLEAADLNDYLMSQSIPRFASTGDRDVEMPAPVDGQLCYVDGVGLQMHVGEWAEMAGGTGPQGPAGPEGPEGPPGADGEGGGGVIVYTTATRPAAASVPVGTAIYDSTLHKPLWSDGSLWRDALSAGTPPNDLFADAWPVRIPTNGATYVSPVVHSLGYVQEASEPAYYYQSCWWTYTPLATGTVTLDTELSHVNQAATIPDTYLTVFTGSAVDALTLVALNDDGGTPYPTSKITAFAVTGGVTYRIRVGCNVDPLIVLRATGTATA